MRIKEVSEANLTEEQVLSSWIDELVHDPSQDAVIMTLLNGRSYTVYGVDEEMYDQWIAAPSKGKFWHEYIRDYHQVI